MNQIIKTMCEIIGDHQEQGGYLFPYSQQPIPILLNKDKTTTYPEIRLSPFIQNSDYYTERYAEKTLRNYREWKTGKFQVDIFAKTLPEVNNIYLELRDRIYDFFNLEVLTHSYNKYFEKQNDNLYKNMAYALNSDFFVDIYHIEVCNEPLLRVFPFEDLIDESFFIDNEALYVQTSRDIKTIKVTIITQGRLFDDKTSPSNRGIAYHEIGDPRNLSELESNEVERISFDIYILFAAKRTRDKLPNVDQLRIKNKSDFYGRKKENNQS